MSERSESNGGGGIRTPVPRYFKPDIYMRSRSIKGSLISTPNDKLQNSLFC